MVTDGIASAGIENEARRNPQAEFNRALEELLNSEYGKLIILAMGARRKIDGNLTRYPLDFTGIINPEYFKFKEPLEFDVVYTALLKVYAVIKIFTEVDKSQTGISCLSLMPGLEFFVEENLELIEMYAAQIKDGKPYSLESMDAETSISTNLQDFAIDFKQLDPRVLRSIQKHLSETDLQFLTQGVKNQRVDTLNFHKLSRVREEKEAQKGVKLSESELNEILTADEIETTEKYSKPFWIRFRGSKAFATHDLSTINTAALEFFVKLDAIPIPIIKEAYASSRVWEIGPRINLAELVSLHPELVKVIMYRNFEDTDDQLRVLPKKRHNMVKNLIVDGIFPYQLASEMITLRDDGKTMRVEKKRLEMGNRKRKNV